MCLHELLSTEILKLFTSASRFDFSTDLIRTVLLPGLKTTVSPIRKSFETAVDGSFHEKFANGLLVDSATGVETVTSELTGEPAFANAFTTTMHASDEA